MFADTITTILCDIEEPACRTSDVLRRVPGTMVFQSAITNALYKISLITAHHHNAFVFRLQNMLKIWKHQQLKVLEGQS